jgi:hypothetical protein
MLDRRVAAPGPDHPSRLPALPAPPPPALEREQEALRALRQELAGVKAAAARRERVLDAALALERGRIEELGYRLDLQDLAAQPVPDTAPALAQRVRAELQQLLARRQREAGRLEQLLEALRAHDLWRHLADAGGAPFVSFEAFVVAAPPHGLGYRPAAIEAVLRERRDYALRARVLAAEAKPLLPSGQHRTPETADTTARRPPGTSAAYLVARLARDRPEYLARLRAGEFPSAFAAAVDAGIATPMCSMRLEPVAIARQLLKRLTAADVQRVVALLTDPGWLNGPLGDPRRRRPAPAAA